MVPATAQEPQHFKRTYGIYRPSPWADSLLQHMTLEEKVGQLFMVASWSNKGNSHEQEILDLIGNYHIGGVCMFQGGPIRNVLRVNRYQDSANIPLLISMDAEWGPAMRLDSVLSWPRQMTLGAIQNDSLVYLMGRAVAEQLKLLGVQVNLAPVVDINNNPLNPVIHTRSFGEERENVARKGNMYSRGMQDSRVLAVAKHFPGHGDTHVDSHKDLPVIPFRRERLDSLELYPFQQLLKNEVGGVMAAHLHIPELDSTPNRPGSLSPQVLQELLREEMNFRGLVFSDALNMKGVTKYYRPGEADLMALRAGTDVLLYPEDVPTAVETIMRAVQDSFITMEELDRHVRRILQVKDWLGLDRYEPVDTANLFVNLNRATYQLLKQRMIEEATTLLANQDSLVPMRNLGKVRIASVAFGAEEENHFQQMMERYTQLVTFNLPRNPNKQELRSLALELEEYDRIIVSLHGMSRYNVETFGLNKRVVEFVNALDTHRQMLTVIFGTPYSLQRFPELSNVLLAYEDDSLFQHVVAQQVFGAIPIRGKLPVNAAENYPLGAGIEQNEVFRLKYTLPEEVGISSENFNPVDQIARFAIEQEATPGEQILVAKDGKVIYYKGFGHHTYEQERPVQVDDMYDLASITKVAATTMAVMKLYEEGKLKLKDRLEEYLPELKGTPKGDATVAEVLTHQAGLEAWIPFYRYTLTEGGMCDSNYCYEPNTFFARQVAEGLYINATYEDEMWQRIFESPEGERGTYRYSDLGLILMKRIVDSLTQQDFEQYLHENFYDPLGMGRMGFNPAYKYSLTEIVPTEEDDYFRNQLVHGHVHDPGAAMFGGVAGHAGLFSTANDLAILMQMLLNGGEYGGRRYFQPETVELFTSKQFKNNRKGLGFDKPETDRHKVSPTSELAPPETFGHTGFTGTAVWADPVNDLIFIFLSNRIHPTAENKKLIKMDIRTDMQTEIYKSLPKRDLKVRIERDRG